MTFISYAERRGIEVAQRYGECSWRELVRLTQEFEEWKDNDPRDEGADAVRIPIDDILRAVGWGDEIEAIKEDLAARITLLNAVEVAPPGTASAS